MDPEERLTGRRQRVQRLLADAGIKDFTHLHRIVKAQNPELEVDRVTIQRYMTKTPGRRDVAILRAIARACDIELEELELLLTPPYVGGKSAAPPGRHLAVVPPNPASSGVSSSSAPAKALGPRSVASERMVSRKATARTVPRVTSSGGVRPASPERRR